MPDTARNALTLVIVLWAMGWAFGCLIDATVARWPEPADARRTAPPMFLRWLALLILWPLSVRAVLGARRRPR